MGWAAPLSGQAFRAFSLSIENDGFVFWNSPQERTDWYYTHGLRVDAVLAWSPALPDLLGFGPSPACPPHPEAYPWALTRIGLGQAIYTPYQLFNEDPPEPDRPYAGWLSLKTVTARYAEDRYTSLGIELGVTGEPSLAGPLHRWFHRSLGKYEPQGWDKQIPFELAFSVEYETGKRISLLDFGGGGHVSVQPAGAVTLGTLRTGVRGGVFLLAGWKGPRFMDSLLAPGESGYVSAAIGPEAELVLRDLFLDGSTWGGSEKAERVPAVGHVVGRVQVGWRSLALEFAATRTSIQFTGQRAPHTVGTVRVILRP